MKYSLLTALLTVFIYINAEATPSTPTLSEQLADGYYVTIGVYAQSKESYAKRYMKKAISMGYNASYGFSKQRNYFYVYLLYSKNFKEALAEMREARKVDEFNEAWVYVHIDASTITNTPKVELAKSKSTTDSVEDTEGNKNEAKNVEDPEPSQEVEEMAKEEPTMAANEKKEEKKDESPLENKSDEVPKKEISSLADVEVVFDMVNARNKKEISGDIQVVDLERSKLLEVVQSGKKVNLTDPNNGTGRLLLICERFGYRKAQKEIHYYSPLLDTASAEITLDDAFVVNFEMIRYHVGDIATMFNVYFFKDAAIMQPESHYEIDQLLQMMEENEHYVIRIHGHTNGNRAGKIIKRKDDQEFFALNSDNIEGHGSAKKLSEERAKEIKDYLISKGIPEERMEIKAWGGKRMVHDKLTNKARYNVRVEIEILEE